MRSHEVDAEQTRVLALQRNRALAGQIVSLYNLVEKDTPIELFGDSVKTLPEVVSRSRASQYFRLTTCVTAASVPFGNGGTAQRECASTRHFVLFIY